MWDNQDLVRIQASTIGWTDCNKPFILLIRAKSREAEIVEKVVESLPLPSAFDAYRILFIPSAHPGIAVTRKTLPITKGFQTIIKYSNRADLFILLMINLSCNIKEMHNFA